MILFSCGGMVLLPPSCFYHQSWDNARITINHFKYQTMLCNLGIFIVCREFISITFGNIYIHQLWFIIFSLLFLSSLFLSNIAISVCFFSSIVHFCSHHYDSRIYKMSQNYRYNVHFYKCTIVAWLLTRMCTMMLFLYKTSFLFRVYWCQLKLCVWQLMNDGSWNVLMMNEARLDLSLL